MKDRIPAHACIESTPSGSIRSSINFTPIGERCTRCGVLIIEQYAIWPKGIDATEKPSETGADTHESIK